MLLCIINIIGVVVERKKNRIKNSRRFKAVRNFDPDSFKFESNSHQFDSYKHDSHSY